MAARVLVAADAPMVVGILSHKLRREGHDVTPVRGAADLARALEDARFDCAVCEAALLEQVTPGAVAGDTGHSPSLSVQRWLAIIDGRDEDAAVRAMRAGAAGIVRTPFKPTEVAAQVWALLAMAGAGA